MSGEISINEEVMFTLGTRGIDAILESTREKFHAEDVQYVKEIYEWYDRELPLVVLKGKSADHFNAFYRATLDAYDDWEAKYGSLVGDWRSSLLPFWQRLLTLLRSDPRWRNSPS